MASSHLILELFVTFFAGVIGLTCFSLYRVLQGDSETVLTKFKLKSEETYHDFALIGAGTVIMIFAGVMYGVSGATDNKTMLWVGRGLLITTLTLISISTTRMWRRSR